MSSTCLEEQRGPRERPQSATGERRWLGSCKAAWICDLLRSAIHLRPHVFGDSITACQPEACPAAPHSHRLSSCHRTAWCNDDGGGLPTRLCSVLSELAGACAAMLSSRQPFPLNALAHVQRCWTARRACQARRRWQICLHKSTSCSARGPCCSALSRLRPVCRQPPWLTHRAFWHR